MEHWYALYTKPRKEYQVRSLLQEQAIEAYLPTIQRKVRRRDRPETKVFFPCYLFARIDFDVIPRSSIAWMPGIRRIVGTGEQPAIVADEIVEYIRRRLQGKEEIGYGDLQKGDRVRIISGPLRDLDAVFDQPLSAAQRVRVLLHVMGRLTPVEIDPADIQRI
jgi:transcription elongation factor/antiterminator RfaH